eukprot:1895044-Alexandrium_andersonii.AAC.1
MSLGVHVLALQETRTARGRKQDPAFHQISGGSVKGQYGCEVWVAQTIDKRQLRQSEQGGRRSSKESAEG